MLCEEDKDSKPHQILVVRRVQPLRGLHRVQLHHPFREVQVVLQAQVDPLRQLHHPHLLVRPLQQDPVVLRVRELAVRGGDG